MNVLMSGRRQSSEHSGGGCTDECGFTLIELLMTLVVMPLIVGAIVTVVITSIKDQAGVSGRISDSSSSQITSAFYVRDVESASFVTTKGSASTPVPCGFGTPSVSGLTFRLGLTWGSPTAGGVVVSYWENSTTGDLIRLYCTNGSPTPASTVGIAHGLSTASPVGASVSPSAAGSAAANGWVTTVGVSSVTLGALETASSYHFDLVAVPQSSVEGNGGTPAPPPLLLLGTGGNVLNCSGSNGQINVNGPAYIDSGTNGAVNLGNSTLTATSFYTTDSPPSQSVSTGPHGSYSPAAQNGPVVPDPNAGLIPPTAAAAPAPVTHGSTTTYFPGTYSAAVSLSGNGNVIFATGTYIFQQGISTAGSVTVSSAVGGVLFYVSGGSVSMTGNGAVTLSPETPAPYAPTAPSLVIWQAKADTNPVLVAGNGQVHTISGTIYAPGAVVGGGGNGNYQAGSIISAGLACNGNGTIGVG